MSTLTSPGYVLEMSVVRVEIKEFVRKNAELAELTEGELRDFPGIKGLIWNTVEGRKLWQKGEYKIMFAHKAKIYKSKNK